MPLTGGLMSRIHIVAEKDSQIITLLRSAGAIILAATNTSELCMWYESNNSVHGLTKNAYHLGRGVGGSSGLYSP